MPTTKKEIRPVAGSTCVITVSFADEAGAAMSPDSAIWSLVDADGTVINSREDVAISNPGSSEDIVLSGDDLPVESGETERALYLLIEGTYTSDAGSGLPFQDYLKFYVVAMKEVATA